MNKCMPIKKLSHYHATYKKRLSNIKNEHLTFYYVDFLHLTPTTKNRAAYA